MFLRCSLGALNGILILSIPKLEDSAVSIYEGLNTLYLYVVELRFLVTLNSVLRDLFSFKAYIDVFKHEKT